jgi:hypothetical protein
MKTESDALLMAAVIRFTVAFTLYALAVPRRSMVPTASPDYSPQRPPDKRRQDMAPGPEERSRPKNVLY